MISFSPSIIQNNKTIDNSKEIIKPRTNSKNKYIITNKNIINNNFPQEQNYSTLKKNDNSKDKIIDSLPKTKIFDEDDIKVTENNKKRIIFHSYFFQYPKLGFSLKEILLTIIILKIKNIEKKVKIKEKMKDMIKILMKFLQKASLIKMNIQK